MTISANFPNVQPSLLLDFANAKQLPPSVNFTRATTATYYNGSTTALAEQNMCLQSQTFNVSPWGVSNGTVSANSAVAPDGTSTADLLYPSGASVITSVSGAGSGIDTSYPSTLSVYAKANGINNIWFISGNGSSAAVWFNVSAGTVGTTATGYTASIVSVGSGWYRCIVTGAFSPIQIGISASDGSYTSSASGTNGVYLWGCQFEGRSSVTAYNVTTTSSITNYIPVLLTAGGGQPRFDHDPTTGESLGLLLEEQRTNLQAYSSTGYGWASYLSATWNSSSVVAPNGQIQAAEVTFPNGSQMYSYTSSFGSSGISVTASAYMKYKSGASIIGIGLYDNTQGNKYVYFDLSNGTISSSDAGTTGTITSVGNGWYRCTNTKTVQNASGGMSFLANNGASVICTWGAQLEVGAVATSYIPTTTASATRAADYAQMTGANFSSWFDLGEGTFYSELSLGILASTQQCILGVNASNAYGTGYGLLWRIGGTTDVQFGGNGSGANGTISPAASANTAFKVTAKYKVSTKTQATQGNTAAVTTSTSLDYTGLSTNQLQISGYRYSSEPIVVGRIKKIAYYPVALTDAQMVTLSS